MYSTAEDMACIVGGVTLGLIPETENMKNGEIAKMLHADLESAREFTSRVAKIPYGKFRAVAVAPMSKLNFEPDIVVTYGNTAQVMRVIQGYLYKRGGRVAFSTGGSGACVPIVSRRLMSMMILPWVCRVSATAKPHWPTKMRSPSLSPITCTRRYWTG
jgi:uncharacterized protein (DUF169 family)